MPREELVHGSAQRAHACPRGNPSLVYGRWLGHAVIILIYWCGLFEVSKFIVLYLVPLLGRRPSPFDVCGLRPGGCAGKAFQR